MREEAEGKSWKCYESWSEMGGDWSGREREGWREGNIITVGGCQGEREEKEAEGGKERRERGESPAHSGKTIQLVSKGMHSTLRERKR